MKAIFGAFPLIERGQWLGLALLVGVTALLFWIYLSPRRIPAKYLIPGTLFLLVFQVFPVLYTMSTAFTNFGDAHRGSKEDAIRAIEGASVTKVPGSADYRLSVATKGDPTTGDIVFLLTDVETKQPFVGTAEGLEQLPAGEVQLSPEGNITQAPGYTILSLGQAGAREEDLADFSVPTDKGGDCQRRPDTRLRGRSPAGLRPGLRLHQGPGDRPDLDGERLRRPVRRRQG